MEGVVIADLFRQWGQQVAGLYQGLNVSLDIAVEDDPRLGRIPR